MSDANLLGSLVKGARERAGLTQRELADQMTYSEAWIQKIERGASAPGVKVLAALASVLQLSPWETRYLHLLGGRLSIFGCCGGERGHQAVDLGVWPQGAPDVHGGVQRIVLCVIGCSGGGAYEN